MPPPPSARLLSLAALIRAPLLGETVPAASIDAELAMFAVERHRVGLLLQATGLAQGEVEALLARHRRDNTFRQARTEILLKEIAAQFAAAEVPWLTFKGTTLARALYPDPTLRHANDIDLLVPPGMFARAQAALKTSGIAIVNTELAPAHWIERGIAALAKDVMLKQERSGLSVELHRRLFFAGQAELRLPLLRETFRPRLGRDAQDIPTPPVGAGLALYLVLHGASCRWFRLKWLADLLPLIVKLDDAQKRELMDAAEQMQATATVKAALQLLTCVFGALPLGPLAAWSREPDSRAESRADAYLAALDNPAATDGKSDGKRFDALDMYYSMMDSPRYRAEVLLRGGAWIALRAVRKAWPR